MTVSERLERLRKDRAAMIEMATRANIAVHEFNGAIAVLEAMVKDELNVRDGVVQERPA